MTYWVSDKQPLTEIENWRKVTAANFQKLLVAATDKFPKYDQAENEKQSHTALTASGFASCTIGHHAVTSSAMNRIVRTRASVLTI
jgi:hypothetical protein